MRTTLSLLRHGRAGGQGPEATLLDEGIAQLTALGRALAREGFAPGAAFSSPYRRARETANLVLGELGSGLEPVELPELTPEGDPAAALHALLQRGLPGGAVLVVAHMPLLSHMVAHLTEELVGFSPGTLVDIELTGHGMRRGIRRRTLEIGAGDPG